MSPGAQVQEAMLVPPTVGAAQLQGAPFLVVACLPSRVALTLGTPEKLLLGKNWTTWGLP